MLVINTVDDDFALDVRVVIDVRAGDGPAPCGGGTNDGCDPSCASACVSGGV